MHPYFKITSSDIQSLDDEQARELVALLCKAELLSKGLGTSPLSWGGDQRAKDGGVDVRVEVNPEVEISGYIPKCITAFQVKAENFSASKIPSEMAPRDVLRPTILELSDKSGAYIIISTKDHCTDSSLNSRKTAMSNCLKKQESTRGLFIDFYDSQKMADWASNFPAVVTWLRSVLGKPIQGWRPYGPWAYQGKSIADEYLLDGSVNVFVPNSIDPISVIEAINRLREELVKHRTSVRIVGLSGVGKTRLIQALFDDRVKTDAATLNQSEVIYTDLSDNPSPQPNVMLETLVQKDSDALIVVDNCGQEVHSKLTEIIKRPNSKISIITVEYDIRDHLPDGTACYRLEGASEEIITKLLKRHFQKLSVLDIKKITDFSDGNARLALALGSTAEAKGELAHLQDDELFRRLFVQKHTESNELQRCAEVASLLYSFDVEDISEHSEQSTLATIAEVTTLMFYRQVSELQKRGLVQERGKWRAVLPQAISNRLALSALGSIPTSILIKNFVTDASDRVTRSFSRRLGYLHESKQAQMIIDDWLKPEGFLGDVANLSSIKLEMLENVSPVNQLSALNAILRAIKSSDFISTANTNRGQVARLIRSLAYESDLFNKAVSALLEFVLAESEAHESESTRETLQSLFYLHLSGTLASTEQRAKFVKALVSSGDSQKSSIGLVLLKAALETYSFSSYYSFDFGALKRGYGWSPETLIEAQAWYEQFINIAIDLGKSQQNIRSNARTILGDAFRGLWVEARMYDALTNAAKELDSDGGWPDGWIGIRSALNLDKDRLESGSLDRLKTLEKELSPKDLQAIIQAKVLRSGLFGAELDDFEEDCAEDRYAKSLEDIIELGKAAAQDKVILADLVPFVSGSNGTNKVGQFAYGLGQASRSTRAILDHTKLIIERSALSVSPHQFVTGLINGWNSAKPNEVAIFLDEAVEDSVWGPLFPSLQCAIELDHSGYLRLLKSLGLGLAPSGSFAALGYGRKTDSLTVNQLSDFLNLLSAKSDGGLCVAIDVLYMAVHCAMGKDDQYKEGLRAFSMNFFSELDWRLIALANENFVHHLELIVEFALNCSKPDPASTNAVKRMIQMERAHGRILPRRLGNFLVPFFKRFPIETLDAVYTIEEGNFLIRMLSPRIDRDGETAIGVVDEECLISWCRVSPKDRCVFVAHTCKLLEGLNPSESSDATVTGISNTAKNLLALAPDKKRVLDILVDRFSPNAWSGSLALILRNRLKYLDDLNPTSDPEITRLLEKKKVDFLELIEKEEAYDQRQESSRNTSFE